MTHHHLHIESAFKALCTVSMDTHRRLTDVAEAVIDPSTRPGRT